MTAEKPDSGKKYCNCGNSQSYPIPHEHDRTEREARIIEHFREALAASEAKFQKCDLRRIHLQQLTDELEHNEIIYKSEIAEKDKEIAMLKNQLADYTEGRISPIVDRQVKQALSDLISDIEKTKMEVVITTKVNRGDYLFTDKWWQALKARWKVKP